MNELPEDVEVNENGGIGSALKTRLDLTPPLAWLKVGEVLKLGADKMRSLGKHEQNWRDCPVEEHIKHALEHIAKHMAGDIEGCLRSDEHISHFACRAMMALEVYLAEQAAYGRRALAAAEDEIEYCRGADGSVSYA